MAPRVVKKGTPMLASFRYLVVLLAVVALACTSLRTGYDLDPRAKLTEIKTFRMSIASLKLSLGPERPFDNERARTQLFDTILRELEAKGWRRMAGASDVIVEFKVVGQERLHFRKYTGRDEVQQRLSGYTDGTLIIDFRDPRSNKLVWRGWAKDTVRQDSDVVQARVQEAVSAILAQFPPAP